MGWGRYGVCEACWEEVAPFAGQGGAEPVDPLQAVIAWGPYERRLRDVIHALKYHGCFRLGKPLGLRLAEAILRAGIDEGLDRCAIVPVPLPPGRLARRGYNQSLLLAREVRRALRRSGMGSPLLAQALVRTREAPPQAGLNREERLTNPRGSFAPARGASRVLEGRSVLLVDDVLTTGATANECAIQLRRAGAREVAVAVVARALPPAAGLEAGGDHAGQGRRE